MGGSSIINQVIDFQTVTELGTPPQPTLSCDWQAGFSFSSSLLFVCTCVWRQIGQTMQSDVPGLLRDGRAARRWHLDPAF